MTPVILLVGEFGACVAEARRLLAAGCSYRLVSSALSVDRGSTDPRMTGDVVWRDGSPDEPSVLLATLHAAARLLQECHAVTMCGDVDDVVAERLTDAAREVGLMIVRRL